MFKYRFPIKNKDNVIYRINQMTSADVPCGKSVFGGDLYDAGIHFTESEEKIKGFFLDCSEVSVRGNPLRVRFNGRFISKNDDLFFDVFIYPDIFQMLVWLLRLLSTICLHMQLRTLLVMVVR